MSVSLEPYRTQSGRVAYKPALADTATKLRIREAELTALRRQHEAIPRVIRIICQLVRGKEV